MTNNQTIESRRSRLANPKRSGGSCVFMIIVLVSGLLAGLGLTIIYDLDDKATDFLGLPPKPRKSRSIAELRDSITERYATKLNLSDEQTDKVRTIVTEHLSDSLERRKRLLDKLSAGLEPILNDTQKAEWEKAKAEQIKKWGDISPTKQPGE
jgi:hypothetical protein